MFKAAMQDQGSTTMSFWTIILFAYLVLSVIVSATVMAMFILGKRSDQRCLHPHNARVPQFPPQPGVSGDRRFAA